MPDSRPTSAAPLQLRVRFARPEDLRFFYEKQIRVDRSLRVETKRLIPVGTRVVVLLSLAGAVGTLPLHGSVELSAAIPGLSPAVTIELDDGDAGVASVASFIDYVESLYDVPAPAANSDRRVTARLAVTAPVWLRFDADAAFANFYTKDVSRSGVFVFSNSQLPDGSPVEVLLAAPGDERGFIVPGKIARHVSSDPRKKGGMAIHFVDAESDPATRDQLDRYLRHLVGPATAANPPARLFAEPPNLAAQQQPAKPPETAPGVGTREPDPDEAIARLAKIEARARVLLRPASLDRLRDLFNNELRRGLVFVYAERPPQVGRPVDLTLIVPETHEPISLEGKVERYEPDEQRAVGGRVGIRLLPLSPTQDTILARICGPATQQKAPPEPPGGPPTHRPQEPSQASAPFHQKR